MGDTETPVLADIGSRGAALLLDLLLVVLVLGLVSETGGAMVARPAVILFAFAYFAGMPLTRMQGTLGKWICRIKLCDLAGGRLGWRAALIRAVATLGWLALPGLLGEAARQAMVLGIVLPVVLVTYFLPWAVAGFLSRRQSLFDLLAGSLVVRRKADAASVASIDASARPSWIRATGFALICLISGFMLYAGTSAFQDQERRGRVMYAIQQTQPLRERIEAFHAAQKRWPTPAEAGVAEWTPYPAGGGYRLGADGSVTISFSQAPELKGRSITFRPVPAPGGGKVDWKCTTAGGLRPGYVPGACRE